MKNDYQHSPDQLALFNNLTDDDLVSNNPNMISLSQYHKRQHYLLNYYTKDYSPPSWTDNDNIFPGNIPSNPLTHIEWASTINSFGNEGDILEFGVACGGTIRDIAAINLDRRVHGFDHFLGLEQTQKEIPEYTGWYEGAFKLGGPEYRQTYEQVIEDLSQFDNISLIVEDVHKLEDPSEYEISKICAVHIDLDIYEPTVSAFKFIDKCDWNQIYMRFDDWHGHEPDYDQHERLACKQWLEEKKYKYELLRNGNHGELIVSR